MFKFRLTDQNGVIGYKRKTKFVNKFKEGLKSKSKTTREIKFTIFHNNYKQLLSWKQIGPILMKQTG